MITDAQYQAWLRNPRSERVVLHEFADVKLANRPHIAFIEGVPHSFASITAGPLEFEADLSAGLNVGDLEVINTGKYDALLDEAWRGTEFTTRWGAADWDYEDFRVVARLVIDEIVPVNKSRLKIRFFDQRHKLDKPVLTQRDGVNNDLLPLILGGVNLAEAVQTSALIMEYQVSILPLESLEVLDSGVGAAVSADLESGTFQLSMPPSGELRVNAVAAHKTPLEITQYLAGLAGLSTVTALNFTDHQHTVQLHCRVSEDVTVEQVLTELLQPLGIYHRINLLGELELLHMSHDADAEHVIRSSMIASGSLQPGDPVQPASAIRVHWKRQYSPFSESALASRFDADSATAENLEQREKLMAEYQLIERETGYDTTHYDAEDFYTAISHESDAITEAEKRLAGRSVKRTPWSLDVFAAGMAIREGDRVQVIHPRFGLATGKTGTVTRAKLRLGNTNRIGLEVLI